MVHPEWGGLLEVINDFIYPAYEITDLDVAGIVQSPKKVYFIALERLMWEEVRYYVLHNQIIVRSCLCSKVPCIFFKNSEYFFNHEFMVNPVLLGYYGQILSLYNLLQQCD